MDLEGKLHGRGPGFPAALEDSETNVVGYGEPTQAGSELRQRQLLQTMSLVHPEWTGPGPGPAQSAPRDRVDIRSPKVLERFLRSSSCGAWVAARSSRT